MQGKTKILAIAAIFALIAIGTPRAQAGVNWADYFTKDEASAIKKMVDKYIRNQIENESEKWEGVINKDAVDDSIAKRKVYTGTFPASIDDADAVDCVEDDPDECSYHKKIAVPEIDISDWSKAPLITVYTEGNTALGDVWTEEDYNFEDGYLWLLYANAEIEIESEQFNDAYKIIVSY